MKNLFDPSDTAEIQRRLATLSAGSQPVWGKMNVGQAMAHCAVGLESATGDRRIKPVFIGKIFGPLVKRLALSDDAPMKKNSPTAREFLVPADSDFASERARLSALIDRFSAGGNAACTREPHAFFGRLTPEQWAILMYKHLDHHLRQFGA